MATVTQAPKQRKPRPQPAAVHGVARWIGSTATQGQLDAGDAVLQITAEGKEPSFFFVAANKDDAGLLLGYRLLKIDGLLQAATYDVDATGRDWTCDCPDAVYCDRPGGCKHSKGLKAALAAAKLLN